MSLKLKKRLLVFLHAKRHLAFLSVSIFGAFALFAFNAMYNQPASHPQPLWAADHKLVTHTTPKSSSIPIRKVETLKFRQPTIPVPMLRPARNADQPKKTALSDKHDSPNTRKVQRLLRELGFYQGELDGLMGPQTLSAVRKFEESKGLPQNANISPSLLLLLQNAVDRSTAKSTSGIDKLLQRQITKKPESTTKDNSLGPKLITRIQVGLINYGSDDITIDGVLGDQTKIAIKQFQARFKLPVNGKPSQELIRKLENVGALTRG